MSKLTSEHVVWDVLRILYNCPYTNCWFLSVLFSGLVYIEREKSDGEIEESPKARGVCRGHLDNDKPGTKAGEPASTVQRVVRPLQPSPRADFSHHPVMIFLHTASSTFPFISNHYGKYIFYFSTRVKCASPNMCRFT